MHPFRPQTTIATSRAVVGFGYWSGEDVRVEFHPADVDTGLVFVREDLKPAVRIPAHVRYRQVMPLRTTLAVAGGRVEMVEHVLAAVAGLAIDNCEIRVTAAEMPGCDGSSQAFVEALTAAGRICQPANQKVFRIEHSVRLGDEQAWIEAHPASDDSLTIDYLLDYGAGSPIGRQQFAIRLSPDVFRQELAASRTFARIEEAEALKAQGLGLRVTARDLLVFDEHGLIDNQLRFVDECVRHKILDLVGDLALAGMPIVGRIAAFRSGHRLNAELVARLLTDQQNIQQHARCA